MKNCINAVHDKYIEVCESLDWRVHQYETSSGEARVELENWSPLGENLVLDFSADNLVDEVKEYAAYFAPEEHAEMWINNRGQNGTPDSIRALLNDADEIDEMLRKLASKLFEVKLKIEADE
ncbi:MAG: hypothetical protein K1W18_07145 [Oscillospiraceae bacterium]